MKATLITLGVLIVLLVALDFGARFFATGQVEKAIASELELRTEPDVSVSGFPFLLQAFSGDYGEIVVTTQSMALGPVTDVNATITLQDVRIPFSDAIAGRTDGMSAGRALLRAEIPASSLAAAAGRPELRISAGPNGELQLDTEAQVLDQTIPVTAVADATFVDGTLDLTVSQVTSTVDLPAELRDQIGQDLNLTIPLTGLPIALSAADIGVVGSSVVVTAAADNISLDDLQVAQTS